MITLLQTAIRISLISLALIISSCDKPYFKQDKDDLEFKSEVLGEQATVTLLTSDFETHINNSLEHTYGSAYYTKGTISYSINNTTIAQIDFGDGTANSTATLTTNNSTTNIALAKQNMGSLYSKVIVNPLIKTNTCAYIVQGTVKYYDLQTGDLVATIDFGDGSCDEWATKTWPSGNYGGKTWSGGSKTFNMDDWLTK